MGCLTAEHGGFRRGQLATELDKLGRRRPEQRAVQYDPYLPSAARHASSSARVAARSSDFENPPLMSKRRRRG
jgi:hypothetical protein